MYKYLKSIIPLTLLTCGSILSAMNPGVDPAQYFANIIGLNNIGNYDPNDISRFARNLGTGWTDRNDRAELERKLHNGNDAEKTYAQRRLAEFDQIDNLAAQAGQTLLNGWSTAINGFAQQELKKQEAAERRKDIAIEAEFKKRTKEAVAAQEAQASIERTRQYLAAFTDPNTAKTVALYALGIFGSYYGLKFGFKVLEDWYGVPELADKTTIIPFHKQLYNKIMGIKVFNKTRDDIILNDELKEFMNEYIAGTKNIIAHGGHLNHVLLPGPPGTGKTLMAEVIATELGLPSIYFAASNLLNCDIETALVRLDQLFAYAKNSPVPIVITIDEAEMIFGDRNKAASEKVSAIKTKIMAVTGTEQSNFILIALTNRIQDFDKAFKSRFNNIIEVTPPAHAQRKQILELYVNQYIKNPKFTTKGSFLGRLFKKKKTKEITFDEKLFNAQGMESLARQLEGFTGRNISHFVMDIRKKALASPEAHISQTTVDKALAAMKRKVEEERRDFAAGAPGK